MKLNKLLVANRGEIAVRIIRAASELGIKTCSIYSEADINSIHWRRADESFLLEGHGAQPYLDIEQIVNVAADAGCDAIHPGYGFLSENPDFAIECESAGMQFVGPESSSLNIFGDKVLARRLAVEHEVPVLPGLDHSITVAEAKDFMQSLEQGQSAILKAVHGGGGRGVRVLQEDSDV
ncbi:MAG: biotin carboxylase N-terminal domain-containing protein, partial [Dehalococcoidia bacterium]|nr:biotin carboxylase N-terminal domain-containing protein [Dehalococcoidia bacterium]